MQQFDLSIWLQDKSRKVVTRDGNPVRIVCWDRPGFYPIIGYTEDELNLCISSTKSGSYCKDGARSQNDLFFAEEEKELTEFEKAIINIVFKYKYWSNSKDEVKQYIKKDSKPLLDLAIKELKKEFKDEEYFRLITEHYKKGKQDALKSLPKWKKATEHKEFEVHVCVMDKDMFPYLDTEVNEGEYYIELSDLKTLPKEE